MGERAADTMAGKTLIRGLYRAIRDMPEDELRANLTDIRDRLDEALETPHAVPFVGAVPIEDATWDDAGNDLSAIIAGE